VLDVKQTGGTTRHEAAQRALAFEPRAAAPTTVGQSSNALATLSLGVAVGPTCAAGPTRYLQSLLFGIEPLDPVSFAAATLALLTAAALASYLPARRAATIDPLTALRHD
jgi:ABC-type lipoprotein release transport system permease subunit